MAIHGNIPSILSVGAAIQDVFLANSAAFKTVKIDSTHDVTELELGAKIEVNKIDFAVGGGATNAAVTFARQDLKSSFMGSIGDDLAGQSAIKVLDEEGVDTSRIEVLEYLNTDYSTIILAPNGERTILTYRGASTQIDAAKLLSDPAGIDWLYVTSLAGKMDTYDELFTAAKESKIKVFWNPGKKELEQSELVKGLLEDVDVLLVNKEEAQMLFSGETAEELVLHGLNMVPNIIVTDGSDGVYASDGKTIVRAGIYEDVKAIDRTGAGDAFGSGFLSQWAQGADLKQSLLFASANSTSVIQHVGAKTGILSYGHELHSMPMTERAIR